MDPSFLSRVRHEGPDDCWLWTGKLDRDGYGMISRRLAGHRYQRAHRYAYFLATGVHPGEMCVLHRCDVRACCNPSHLWLGTPSDNNADMISKGRATGGFLRGDQHISRTRPEVVPRGDAHYARRRGPVHVGERHPGVRLTNEQVREIRSLYAAGGITQKAVAEQFGISLGHANAIIIRRFRRDVP